MKLALTLLTAGFTLLATPAFAQSGHKHGTSAKAPAASSELFSGEVRRVSTERRSVTLAHGPLDAFNMGPMTMSFGVKPDVKLDAIKSGDKVRFGLERAGDDLVVNRLEIVK